MRPGRRETLRTLQPEILGPCARFAIFFKIAGHGRSRSCRPFEEVAMISQHEEFAGHELVAICHDEGSGLRAIIAIHDTSAGPAMGGCRIASYPRFEDAVTDVLRLSKGMSFK